MRYQRPSAVEMLGKDDPHIGGSAIVVFLDMCSSSKILESLAVRGRVSVFTEFVDELKVELLRVRSIANFVLYKFLGDGWILLFPAETDGTKLLDSLAKFSFAYQSLVELRVLQHIDLRPEIIGLTFGVDVGDLIPAVMQGNKEFIGRALNIASRLRDAVNSQSADPAYKALVSRVFHRGYLDGVDHGYNARPTVANLKNITVGGEQFDCVEIEVLDAARTKMHAAAVTEKPAHLEPRWIPLLDSELMGLASHFYLDYREELIACNKDVAACERLASEKDGFGDSSGPLTEDLLQEARAVRGKLEEATGEFRKIATESAKRLMTQGFLRIRGVRHDSGPEPRTGEIEPEMWRDLELDLDTSSARGPGVVYTNLEAHAVRWPPNPWRSRHR